MHYSCMNGIRRAMKRRARLKLVTQVFSACVAPSPKFPLTTYFPWEHRSVAVNAEPLGDDDLVTA